MASSLTANDILWDVKSIGPGDKEYYALWWKYFTPAQRWRFWKELLSEHKSLFPLSRRVILLKIFLALQIALFLAAVVVFFL